MKKWDLGRKIQELTQNMKYLNCGGDEKLLNQVAEGDSCCV